MRATRSRSIRSLSISLLVLVALSHLAHAQDLEVGVPVEVTSSYAWSHQPATGQRQMLADGAVQQIGEAWQFKNIDTSDPRLAGTLTLTDTLVTYPGGETVSVGAFRIVNDDGAWQEHPTYWRDWDGQRQPGATWQRAFVGEDGYEGLIAVLVDTWRPEDGAPGTDIRLEGFIVEGDLPEAPEPWSVESD